MPSALANDRKAFHTEVFAQFLTVDCKGVPSFADSSNRASVEIAKSIVSAIGITPRVTEKKPSGQTTGNLFEVATKNYIERAFAKLAHLRPGNWQVEKISTSSGPAIAEYEQYSHLLQLSQLAKENEILKSALGTDYTIVPDVVILRLPEEDEVINQNKTLVSKTIATHTSLRKTNNPLPILHASLSCKWTIRSDRSQNARSEALNLIRNRKGRTPHICVITAEPTPSRLASIALGTGDLDCVYHFALNELYTAVESFDNCEALSMLNTLIDGKRLKDISDLPLDLAV